MVAYGRKASLPSGAPEMTRSTSEVAVCSSASRSSRVRALTCSCRSARVELPGRARPLARYSAWAWACCRAAFLLVCGAWCEAVSPSPSRGPTTLRYHIMRPVVHHSKIRRQLVAMGQSRPTSQVGRMSAPQPRAEVNTPARHVAQGEHALLLQIGHSGGTAALTVPVE
jgi:hypothetical protein